MHNMMNLTGYKLSNDFVISGGQHLGRGAGDDAVLGDVAPVALPEALQPLQESIQSLAVDESRQ